MQCVLLCLVLSCAVAVFGYPQRVTLVNVPPFFDGPSDSAVQSSHELGDSSDDTVFDIAATGSRGYDPTDVEHGYYPDSFDDIIRSMQEAMFRLRQEMNTIIRRLPDQPDDKGLDDVFSFGPDFDLSDVKNKSTSETKIIDGKPVTINETVIRTGNDHGASVYVVKTVEYISPDLTDVQTTDENVNPEPTPAAPEVSNESLPTRSKNDDNNDIPVNNEDKVGSEVEDLNKA